VSAEPLSLQDLLAEALRDLPVEDGSIVVQLFGGSGELTQALLPFADRLIAVDRSPEKLQELRRRWPTVETVSGTAGAIPLSEGSVDAVVVADALEMTSATYCEIARVLKHGGTLVVVTETERWREEHDVLRDLEAVVAGYAQSGGEGWRRALTQTRLFEALDVTQTDRELDVGVDAFVALVGSWAWIADLPGEQRAAVLGAVRELVGDHATVTVRRRTEVCSTRAIVR
jgi:SAM-dependent methyltransferase